MLPAGEPPVRVLHISDLHITAARERKKRWIRELARLEPDLVVNTGDTISDPNAIPAILETLKPLARFPAVFVPGNNDYYIPKARSPVNYFTGREPQLRRPDMPWPELATAMVEQGWTELTHLRTVLTIGAATVALAGVDDPHLYRARYEQIAGPRADATVGIGLVHSPEPELIGRFAEDGYELVLAGHTHGGQVCVPFGPAIVTNRTTSAGLVGCTAGRTPGSMCRPASAPSRCAHPLCPPAEGLLTVPARIGAAKPVRPLMLDRLHRVVAQQ